MIKFTFFFFLYIIACRAFLLPYTYNVYLSFKINYYPLPFKRDKIAGLISIYTRTYFISSPLPNEVSITLISLCRFSGGLVRCDQSAHCVCRQLRQQFLSLLQPQLAPQADKCRSSEIFSQYVSQLVVCKDRKDSNIILLDKISNIM